MPVYDYVCSSCHRLTEVVRGIEAEGPRFCPECGAEGTMTKVFSAPSVHFKGTGWAKKDRGSSARSARAKAESGSSDGDGAKTGAGSGGDKASTDSGKPDKGSSGSSTGGSSSGSSGGDSASSSGSSD